MEEINNVTVVDHPLLARDLTILRDRQTESADFRAAVSRMATILACRALEKLPLRTKIVETPLQPATGYELDTDVVIVPILRAGLSLVDAFIHYIPSARTGHLGFYRDEKSHNPVNYYTNLPPGIDRSIILLVDPMLASGGSANEAIHLLKNKGANQIRFICLISAPEGLKLIAENHPDVSVITASIDQNLNNDAHIVPGLGDAGDRYFGT